MQVAYAIVFVSDMKRSVAFYRDVLGIALRYETPEWTEFSTDGATLALHATKDVPSGAATTPAGTCQPGFSVPDLDAFHARLVEHSVRCAQPPTDLHGVRIAQYVDPDGLLFSVNERRE